MNIEEEIAAVKERLDKLEKAWLHDPDQGTHLWGSVPDTRATYQDAMNRFCELYRLLGVERSKNRMPPSHDLAKHKP